MTQHSQVFEFLVCFPAGGGAFVFSLFWAQTNGALLLYMSAVLHGTKYAVFIIYMS